MSTPPGLRERLVATLKKRGPAGALVAAAKELVEGVTSSYAYSRLFFSRRSFVFQGRSYRYLYRRYASAWRSERVVEVPIVGEVVRAYAGRSILEVGNVLAHYFEVAHDRVDKYERAPGVLNEDIVDFAPGKKYDLIVSISTLEHVGFDEEPKDPEKVLRAIAAIRRLAKADGRILVTLPMAYNPELDARLREGRIAFTRRGCLKRISKDNRWAEVDWAEIEHAQFDTPFRRINGLLILELGALA